MISFGRWRLRRLHITNKTHQQVGTHQIGRHQVAETNGPRKRKLKHRWPARTAFDWLAYTSRNQSLRLLRRMRVHVDTTLRTRDGFQETVHWQVISALCPELLEHSTVTTLTKDKSDTRTPQYYTVELPECITSSIARLIVECAYGEPELALDRANLYEFYKVAIEYNIQPAISVCLDYARTILDVYNCIYLLQLSIVHKHHKLRRAAYAMIRANFKHVLHVNNDFQHLQAKQLRQLLLDDALRINENEEIAWLAIVRWASEQDQPMSQSELARLYNQMVSEPQEVVRRTPPTTMWSASAAGNDQQQTVSSHRQHLLQSETMANQQPQLIRLTLDFYSPIEARATADGACNQRTKPSCATDKSPKSPLRAAAADLLGLSCRVDITSSQGEDELYCLIKCLRFMCFKSLGAFDVILANPHVSRSARLTQLVQHMRLRYKLHNKIPLTEQDKQMIAPEELRKIKYHETSRAQRVVKTVGKLIGSTLQARNASPITGTTGLRVETQQQQQQQRPPQQSSSLSALTKLAPALVHEQFSAQSLERARRPRVPTSVGLLIGGWQDGSVTSSIWAYDFVYDKWFKLNIKLPEPRTFHASCSSSRGQVYIFGGTDGKAILNSVLRIQPASDVFISSLSARRHQKQITSTNQAKLVYKFKQLSPMSERRCHLSGLFHTDGRLYALGGHNGAQRLRSGEWYDPQSNQWHSIAEMTIARADAGACSHDNKIFIAGGQISDQFIQSSVEFYKSSDNTWTFAAPMIIPRMAFSLVSYRGHLLAIGGTNGLLGGEEVASVTRTVERYNHNAGAWAFCAPMLQKRCAFGVMHIENKLLVMGGHGGQRRLKTCESLKIGHFSSQALVSLSSAMPSQSLRQRLGMASALGQQPNVSSAPREESTTSDSSPNATAAISGKSVQTNMQQQQQRQQQPVRVHEQARRTSAANVRSLPDLATLAGNQLTANQQLIRAANGGGMPVAIRSAMKWIPKANLPERRSGFSIAVVHKLKNAKDFTYFGSIKRTTRGGGGESTCANSDNNNGRLGGGGATPAAAMPSFIKQPGRWHKFKIIKRRKLVKHLKIALIVTAVILLM